jgi:hypothetical protein
MNADPIAPSFVDGERSDLGALALIVARPDDMLAAAIADQCNITGRRWRWYEPSTIASVQATISNDGSLLIRGEPVRSILWRSSPSTDFGVDFTEGDRSFADTEARAFWVAALNLLSLKCAVRPDASLFFSRSSWQFWRDALADRGVALSPLRIGVPTHRSWLPYSSMTLKSSPDSTVSTFLGVSSTDQKTFHTFAFAGRQIFPNVELDGSGICNVISAVHRLNELELHLGELIVDAQGAVIAVNAFPCFSCATTIANLVPTIMKDSI